MTQQDSSGTNHKAVAKGQWWAFWRRWFSPKEKKSKDRTKNLGDTGEIPALQWDVKTVPAARQPVVQPSKPRPPEPKPPPTPKSSPGSSGDKPTPSTTPTRWRHDSVWWFLVISGLLVLFSIPLWLTSWPPIAEAPAQIGFMAYQQRAVDATSLLPFVARSFFYIGILGEFFVHSWVRVFPASISLSLLLQCWLMLLLLSLIWMLQSAGLSRWNLLLAFPFVYSGALFSSDLQFFMTLPFVFIGLGALYRWLLHHQSMYGLVTMGISWLLLFLHGEAYVVFLVGACLSCVWWGNRWGERFSHLLLPGSSLFLLIPWLVMAENPFASPMANSVSVVSHTPWVWGTWREKALSLWDTITLSTHKDWSDILRFLLLIAFWLGFVSSSPRSQDTSVPAAHVWSILRARNFFSVLGLSLLFMSLLIPQSWKGYTFTNTAPVVVLCFVSVGWIHLSAQHQVGRWAIVFALLVVGGHGYAAIRSYSAYRQEIRGFFQLLKRVPEKSNVLVWSPPQSRIFRTSYHQWGGHAMTQREGLSNIHLSHPFRWGHVLYDPKHPLPSPLAPQFPSQTVRWNYLLTGRTLPGKYQPHWRMVAQHGPFFLYRKQPTTRQAPRPILLPKQRSSEEHEDP